MYVGYEIGVLELVVRFDVREKIVLERGGVEVV